MTRLAGLLVLLCASGASAADDAALRAVEQCRARLDARVDIGIERVRRRCPELLPALERAEWRHLLPAAFSERREEISADSLRALAELVRHARETQVRRPAPDPAALAPVLVELGDKGQEGVTRWERFKRWLRDKFEARRKDSQDGWFDRWARRARTSEGVAKTLTYVGYALLAALVIAVIWAELRAAGLLGGARRAAMRANPAAEWRRRLMLADVMAAPLADRPGMLLRLLGEALTRAHRLPAADGMTAGEIARRAELESAADRESLVRVAATADAVRYGALRPPEPQLESSVVSAKELLTRLARSPKGGR